MQLDYLVLLYSLVNFLPAVRSQQQRMTAQVI